MNTRLVIVGAGGFGRGVHGWATSSPRFLAENQIGEAVFVDDFATQDGLCGPLIGALEDYDPAESDLVLCGVGIIATRRAMVDLLEARGARFATFVDDRAIICAGVKIGEGTIVCPGTVISADAVLGRQVHVNFNCSIGHDTRIGDFSTLSPAVNIMGQVEGGEAVFYGGSATVLPRLSVGAAATLGAGVVITKTVECRTTVVGNPGRTIDNSGQVDA